MKRNIVLALGAIALALPVMAQQNVWERSLTIEGQYNPNTGKQNKLLPAPERKQIVPVDVKADYLTQTPEMAAPEHRSLKVLSESSNDPCYPSFDGYASFGYGLSNVADGKAGIMWRPSDRDRLEISAGMDNYSSMTEGWRQRLADAQAAVSYTHLFDCLELDAFGLLDFSHRNFNRGEIGQIAQIGEDSLLQHSIFGKYGLMAKSRAESEVKWHFGFTQEGLERNGLTINEYTPDNAENIFRVDAGAAMSFDFGTVSVEYRQKSVNREWTSLNGYVYRNFSTFTMTPGWQTSFGKLKTSLGVNLDYRSAMGPTFLVSPQLGVEYGIDDRMSVWGRLDGGLEEHSMYSLALISPYWAEYKPIRDGYTMARFEGGVSFTVPSVLTAEARIGMRHTRDEIFQKANTSGMIVTSELLQEDANVFWTGFDVAWTMNGRFDAEASLDLYSWTGSYETGLLAFKPAAIAQLFAHANVCDGVDVSAGYRFQRFTLDHGCRMNAINELELRADWKIYENLSLYLKGDNLLGRKFQYWAGYRALKPYAMIGATVKF